MAGVGEAASIAGLIAVAGQCLDLLSKLYTLVKAFQDAFPQARKLADELTLLRQCLSQIQNIASRAVNIVPDLSEPVTALFTTVSRCENTVCQIEQKIQTIHPSKKKLIWNRVKVAAARDFFTLLQAQVLSEKQDLILRLDAFSCELDLRTSCNIEHLAASTSSLERNLIDMMQHLGGHSGATERHLLALDARMQTMQQMLEHSISPQRRTAMTPKSRRMPLKAPRHVSQIAKELELPGSRILSRIREPASESVRLISPAFLVYEKNGTAHTKLVALNNGELNRLDVAQKNRMIQYLQSLRLFMWLLKQDNYLTTNSTKDLGMIRSSLAVHAGITSFWEFSNAFSDLATSLDAISYTTLSWLPWLKNKPWLQYVFNRILDRPGDGEKVMELVLKRWPNFPLPDDEVGKYTLSIPTQLLRDTQVQEIWNSYSEVSIRNGPPDLTEKAILECSHKMRTRIRDEHPALTADRSPTIATGNDEIPQSFNTLPWPDVLVEPLQEPQDCVMMLFSCSASTERSHPRRVKPWPTRRTAKSTISDCASEIGSRTGREQDLCHQLAVGQRNHQSPVGWRNWGHEIAEIPNSPRVHETDQSIINFDKCAVDVPDRRRVITKCLMCGQRLRGPLCASCDRSHKKACAVEIPNSHPVFTQCLSRHETPPRGFLPICDDFDRSYKEKRKEENDDDDDSLYFTL